MAYVVVDKEKREWIFNAFPEKLIEFGYWTSDEDFIELPKGSIKKLIGRTLTWEDEPVEIK